MARENSALATLLCHMWKVTKKKLQLHIRWVRGHTGDVGKSIADALADADGRKTSSKRSCRVYREKKHRVNKPFASSGQAR